MQLFSKIDKSRFPIIVVEFASFEPSEAEFEQHLHNMYSIYEQHHGIVVLFDSTNATYLSANERNRYGKWIKQHSELINKSVIGVGYIVPTFTQRTLMKGILMTHPPQWTNKVFKIKNNALLWAEDLLKNA